MKYDLHIHSCLSPCSDDDMTPNNISGMAYLAGLDVIAICDHNNAGNITACSTACDKYNIKLLAGIEVCTNEDIHILCYFKDVKAAINFGEIIKENTVNIPNRTDIYGNQFIVDEDDKILQNYENLLIVGCNLTSFELVNLCHSYNGLCFYAHIDKPSFSVLSVLGALPPEIEIDGVEIFSLLNYDNLIKSGHISYDTPYLSNSDAHTLGDIGNKEATLSPNHPLYKLICND